jgi:hypothetical protein
LYNTPSNQTSFLGASLYSFTTVFTGFIFF